MPERIIVLGAGMAGLSAARRLALAGHAPLLVAPEQDVPNRGETLSRKADRFLAMLQWTPLLDAAAALAGAGRFSVWGNAALRRADDHEGHGHHIDRARLERRMADTLDASGVRRRMAAATALEHVPAGARVVLAGGEVIEAAAVIDCTGRAALSSGEASGRRRLDRLVAAWRVLDLPDDTDTLAATLVEAVELGWWYVSPMPGRRMMVGLFTDSDLLPSGLSRDGRLFAGLVRAAPVAAARLESLGLDASLGDGPPQVAAAASVTVSQLVEGRILRAGDAAAALDPLGANGLASALWSGISAADAALALIEGDPLPARAYEQDFLQGIAHHLANQNALYAAERRFGDAPFWARRSASLVTHQERKTDS